MLFFLWTNEGLCVSEYLHGSYIMENLIKHSNERNISFFIPKIKFIFV